MEIVLVSSISDLLNTFYLVVYVVDEIRPFNHRNVTEFSVPYPITIITYPIASALAIEHVILEYVKEIIGQMFCARSATTCTRLKSIIVTPIFIGQDYRQNTIPSTRVARPSRKP